MSREVKESLRMRIWFLIKKKLYVSDNKRYEAAWIQKLTRDMTQVDCFLLEYVIKVLKSKRHGCMYVILASSFNFKK